MTDTQSPHRILYIDDDAVVCRAFLREVSALGYAVDLAANGSEARQLVQSHEYAIIGSDQRMPDISGIELINELHGVQPNASYVIISAYLGHEDIRKLEGAKTSCYMVPKPWRLDELKAVLEQGITDYQQRVGVVPIR